MFQKNIKELSLGTMLFAATTASAQENKTAYTEPPDVESYGIDMGKNLDDVLTPKLQSTSRAPALNK